VSDTPPAVSALLDRLDGLGWGALVATGAGAFLVGYGLTVFVVVVGPSTIDGGLFGVLTLLAFVFYSAHNVPVEVAGMDRIDWLVQTASPSTPEPAVPVVVFYAIPVVVLLGASLVVAVRVVDRAQDPTRVGAGVLAFVVGYWLAMVAGTFVFTSESIFDGPARLVLTDAAVFGFVYPLVFGTIGAGLAGIVAYRRATHSDSPA